MDFMSTVKGSLLESFYPAGWDMARINRCANHPPEAITERQSWWNDRFTPIPCATLADFDTLMGHEIALTIRQAREDDVPLAMILPVDPIGMYRWAVFFLREWGVGCGHVHGFNMDDWSDGEGNTLPPDNPGAFPNAMEGARLHRLTMQQNAITSLKSRTTLVPCRANTIGPGLFLQSDWIIGGADGVLGRGMQWQGLSLWMTLRHRPDTWVPSSYMPTRPGKLFFLSELAGPLVAECN